MRRARETRPYDIWLDPWWRKVIGMSLGVVVTGFAALIFVYALGAVSIFMVLIPGYLLAGFLCGSKGPRRAWQWAVWLSLPFAAPFGLLGLLGLTFGSAMLLREYAIGVAATFAAALVGAYVGALLMVGTESDPAAPPLSPPTAPPTGPQRRRPPHRRLRTLRRR